MPACSGLLLPLLLLSNAGLLSLRRSCPKLLPVPTGPTARMLMLLWQCRPVGRQLLLRGRGVGLLLRLSCAKGLLLGINAGLLLGRDDGLSTAAAAANQVLSCRRDMAAWKSKSPFLEPGEGSGTLHLLSSSAACRTDRHSKGTLVSQ